MDDLYNWIHDDKTWCGEDCDNTDCDRNIYNRKGSGRYFTMSMLRNTDLCPLKNEKNNRVQ